MKKGSLAKPFALLFGAFFFLLSACATPAASSASSLPTSSSDSPSSSTSVSDSSSPSASASDSSPNASSGATSATSSQSSSSVSSSVSLDPITEGYWAGIDVSGNTVGNAFRGALQSIMLKKGTATGTNSYDALNTIFQKSDRHPNGGVCAFYRNDVVASSWNKEHVWPNSRGAGENRGFAGTDPQVIRPTNSNDNSSRSNYMYAERSDPTAKATAGTGWDPAAFGYPGARGEAARIIFYAATRYFNLSTAGAGGTSHGSKPLELAVALDNNSDAHLMGKLDDMLRWNDAYPVTRAEKYRNDYLTSANYARNPFIDHPEWAKMIWDTNGLRSSSYTPSSSSYSSTSSTPLPTTPYQLVTSTSDLQSGSQYVLASGTSGAVAVLAPQMIKTYYVDKVDASVNGGLLNVDSSMARFTLGGSEGAYTFLHPSMGYLAGTINGTHYNLGFAATASSSTSWALSLTSEGLASLKSGAGVYAAYDSAHLDFTGSAKTATLALFKEVSA
jgi:endonuclease I